MRVATSIVELIGGTPLLRLGALEDGGAEIWAKLEYLNPGLSVKDRIGVAMIEAAEREGRLRPGGTVVEATAGNTGIGLALAARARGYRAVMFVPEKFSREKQRLMAALGAEVVVTPTEEGMEGARRRARRLADSTSNAVYVDQFANPSNPAAHERTTGPEILEQTGGRLDALVAGVGSGGTLVGAARFLKRHLPDLLAVAVEPEGSILGGGPPGAHLTEGIGMDEVTEIWDPSVVDEIVTVPDREAFRTVRELAARCGVLSGSSGGANVWAARRVARRLGRGKRVVTVIPDHAERYLSKGILDLFLEEA